MSETSTELTEFYGKKYARIRCNICGRFFWTKLLIFKETSKKGKPKFIKKIVKQKVKGGKTVEKIIKVQEKSRIPKYQICAACRNVQRIFESKTKKKEKPTSIVEVGKEETNPQAN